MEIIGCGKGHYYNPELYNSCPECAKEQAGAGVLGVTEPVNFNNYAGGGVQDIGATEPVDFAGFPGNGGNGGNGGTVGSTEPVGNNYNTPLSTSDFNSNFVSDPQPAVSKVQEYTPTMPVTPVGTESFHSGVPFMPVVGWLVCIDGPAKGRDYRIHSQYNYIGRAHHMDICISGDDCISAERAAILAYDSEEKFFSFGPGMGHNVVRVNGKMLMNAVALNPYDELTIGKTKLLFVPLCGERFDWNDK